MRSKEVKARKVEDIIGPSEKQGQSGDTIGRIRALKKFDCKLRTIDNKCCFNPNPNSNLNPNLNPKKYIYARSDKISPTSRR